MSDLTFMPGVSMIREILKSKLRKKDFVVDKTGVKTVELVGTSFVADEPIIFGTIDSGWHERELEWYKSQSRCVFDIPPPIPTIWLKVADNSGMINSNYGWCIWSKENGRQFDRVLEELCAKPDSRRAVMIYTRPSMWLEYDLNGRSDFMCTNVVQYMIRNDKLQAVVQMRSNDAVFGYKGDRFWQDWVLKELASCLDIEPGDIIWNAGSLHVYERHFKLMEK